MAELRKQGIVTIRQITEEGLDAGDRRIVQ
jgi:hypothetical protein